MLHSIKILIMCIHFHHCVIMFDKQTPNQFYFINIPKYYFFTEIQKSQEVSLNGQQLESYLPHIMFHGLIPNFSHSGIWQNSLPEKTQNQGDVITLSVLCSSHKVAPQVESHLDLTVITWIRGTGHTSILNFEFMSIWQKAHRKYV